MNILFISKDLIGADLVRKLKAESHNVKLYIKEPKSRKSFDGLVSKTDDWRKELKWVGKSGLIVFDDLGYGKTQDLLRKKGYSVFGGSAGGDKMEANRQLGKTVFESFGLKTVPLLDFSSIDEAINFLKRHRGCWVIKQNGHAAKCFNYVGMREDADDVITVLKNYKKNYGKNTITLQQKIVGVEIGVGRYFNGKNWIGPIEMNLEHKKMFPGSLGPTTSEMGTLAWYDDDEKNKLFQDTLAKIEGYLREIDFRGDAEINCIVNETGAYPLEATMRLGTPIIHLQSEIHQSPWGFFLKAVADGEDFDLKWKRGYGVVILVASPPFPETKGASNYSPEGITFYMDQMTEEEMSHIHFEEIGMRRSNDDHQYFVTGRSGYITYIASVEESVEKAQKKVYNIAKKVFVPKMFYRNDIGQKFLMEDRDKLKKWGYIK